MAVLPYYDIDTRLVGNAIGLGSDDYGQLHVRAKTGGVAATDIHGKQYTSAFQFNETGAFLAYMGKRVDGAFPYWSIWANNQPGEWKMNKLGYGILEHWLKKDDSGVVRFDIGDFRGHNTDASAPGINDVNQILDKGTGSGIIKDYSIPVKAYLGEYEWSRVHVGITHWQVRIMDGNDIIARSTPTPVSTGVAIFSVVFPIIITGTERKDVYTSRVHLGNGVNDFNDFGYVPTEGTITIEIRKPVPQYTLRVGVEGIPGTAFFIPEEYGTAGFNTYTFRCTYNKTFPSSASMGKRLNKAIYRRVDYETGTEKEVIEITSGFVGESPDSLSGWTSSFNREIFEISSSRMVPSANPSLHEQIQVSLYYR